MTANDHHGLDHGPFLDFVLFAAKVSGPLVTESAVVVAAAPATIGSVSALAPRFGKREAQHGQTLLEPPLVQVVERATCRRSKA